MKTIGKLECFVKLGDPVICLLNKQEKFGVLKFAGKTEFSSGVWYGVALNEPCGKNDGSVGGVRYFRCDDKHGIFVNPKNVYPAKLENETKSFVSQKQVSRRVLPNFIKENSADLTENLTVENSTVDKVSCDENYQSIIVDLEVRPRSKSDNALTKEKTKPSELFSDSPFKYDSSEGKSSSLSKLNNITYTCPSPISVGVNDSKREDFLHPKHSSPLSSTHEESPQTAQELTATENSRQHSANESGANTSLSSTVYHHVELSPQVVVKQSIKLESIRNPRFSAPTWSLEEPESNLNKTFLIPRQQSKTRDNTLIDTELTFTGKKGKYEDREDCQMQGTVSKSEQLSKCESLNSTSLSVAESECDATEARSRSFSKSSVSSVDSLSSIGSTKTNQEKGRLKTTGLSTELSRKLPRTSDASKSKLVKISAESKVKSKKVKKESGTINATLISKSSADKSTANGRGLPSKIRTKSSTTVCNGSRSVLDTPASSKSSLKVRPMSVSSKYKERTPLAKSQPNTSKYSTPVGSKILGTVATRRSTSSPLGNASAFEKKVKMTGSASTSMKSSASARANNHVQVQRSLSQESNKSENVSARQVRNKVVGIVKNQTKQEERKLAPTKTRTVSTSRTENASGRSSGKKYNDASLLCDQAF